MVRNVPLKGISFFSLPCAIPQMKWDGRKKRRSRRMGRNFPEVIQKAYK